MSSSSAQQRRDFPRLRLISQHRNATPFVFPLSHYGLSPVPSLLNGRPALFLDIMIPVLVNNSH